jgi:hypothetical protein
MNIEPASLGLLQELSETKCVRCLVCRGLHLQSPLGKANEIKEVQVHAGNVA